MLKEVQPVVCGEESGTKVVVGEFQTPETAHDRMPDRVDPAAENQELQTSAGDCGACRSVGRAEDHSARRCGFFAASVILLVRIYQKLIAPLLPDCCRFEPTCSHYAVEALQIHGFWKGCALTVWRLMRCQPFCKGGYDPVPPRRKNNPAPKKGGSGF